MLLNTHDSHIQLLVVTVEHGIIDCLYIRLYHWFLVVIQLSHVQRSWVNLWSLGQFIFTVGTTDNQVTVITFIINIQAEMSWAKLSINNLLKLIITSRVKVWVYPHPLRVKIWVYCHSLRGKVWFYHHYLFNLIWSKGTL